MGSIPVRSTKKRRMQFCIRRFLVFFLVNPSSVRQYGLPYSCRGTPACGKRQIPVSNISKSNHCNFAFGVFWYSLVNRPRFVNMACHILAEGLPLAGNGKFPSKNDLQSFFEISFYAKTNFSCVSGIKCL